MGQFKKGRAFLYRLEVNYTTIDSPNKVAVCKIDNDEAFQKFVEQYVEPEQSPDWVTFANMFGGIEFCPLPAGPMWLRGYDVDQGCIWNQAAIKSDKLLYHDPSNEIKPKPTSIGQAFEMYPDIYELFTDYHDIDMSGYVPDHDAYWSEMSVEEFIQKEYTDPEDSSFWRSGYYNDIDRALIALKVLSEDGLDLSSLTYSSVDLEKVAETVEIQSQLLSSEGWLARYLIAHLLGLRKSILFQHLVYRGSQLDSSWWTYHFQMVQQWQQIHHAQLLDQRHLRRW